MQAPDVIFVSVLLVSGDPDEADALRALCEQAAFTVFELVPVPDLDKRHLPLAQGRVDLVLYPLHEAVTTGLIERIVASAAGFPVLALGEQDDVATAIVAVSAGAVDYLSRRRLEPGAFERTARAAVERTRTARSLEQVREEEARAREFGTLDALRGGRRATVTAAAYGLSPLSRSDPVLFEQLTGEYRALLELTLEQRAYKVEHDVTDRLRALAEALGLRKAGPRDVIELYTTTVKSVLHGTPHKRAQAYMEEGRLIALELMGHLVSYYRNFAQDVRPRTSDA